jgi:hypothetical protein
MKTPRVKPARMRALVLDRQTGRPVAGVPVFAVAENKEGRRIPLGVLATDHAGFVSFDVSKLKASGEVAHLWVYRAGDEATRVDALEADRLAPGAGLHIFTELPPGGAPIPQPPLPSIQGSEPDRCFVSPNSFFTNPDARLGEHGCEILLPSNSATHEFRFRQVTRTPGETRRITQPTEGPDGSTITEFPLTLELPAGRLLEYRTVWYPLGHSLGRLLYSLPLAPCESVNLAVIDWSRRDDAARAESLAATEDLVHSTRRDRMIEETVKASLDEWQGGGSFMAGHSGAGSFDLGGFLSIGANDAMGGSYSSAGGERDLAASTVQRLSDKYAQASRAVRTLRSTVVTQVSQREREAIQTRVVTNHNHCHAMTVLYYEVLRHYRVITECISIQKVVFVEYDAEEPFDLGRAFCNRHILERVLIDPRLRHCFDAVERVKYCAKPETASESAGNDRIKRLVITITTEDSTDGDVLFLLRLANGDLVKHNLGDEHFGTNETHAFTWEPEDVRASAIRRVGFRLSIGLFEGEWRPKAVRVEYVREDEDELHLLYDESAKTFKLLDEDGDEWWDDVEAQAGQVEGESPAEMRRWEGDKCCADRLIAHLNCHRVYYWNAIWLAGDPNERAYKFMTKSPYKELELLSVIENRPVGAFGNLIAFPELGQEPQPLEDEDGNPLDAVVQCVALPTHGVFAEAELGHCNSCEEKDVTRFWDWSKSPCPDHAPEISPIIAGSRAQQPNLQPSGLPAPVVNIVNPPAAPDPSGMAAAMQVLATPNIFRDMSGLQEVSDLLQKLAEGSVSLAQARAQAGQIRSRQASGDAADTMTPEERHDHDQVTRNAGPEGHGNLTEQEVREGVRATTPRRPSPPSTEGSEPQAPLPDLRTLEVRLRGFVKYEIWKPSLGLPMGAANLILAAIRFNGDDRDFSASEGTSRVDLPVTVRINANDMSIVEARLDRGSFGEAEVYAGIDLPPLVPIVAAATEHIDGEPDWAEHKKVGAVPLPGATGRLAPTQANVSAVAQQEGDGVLIRLIVSAQPYFPFTEETLRFVPDAEFYGVSLRAALGDLVHAALPDVDADIRITVRKRSDGELEYEVSGEHDGFPAWELYVNGDAAYQFSPIDDQAPTALLAPSETRVLLSVAPVARI